VGHWGDAAIDLQYRDLIHNPKGLCTIPFAESQPALYYWKTCSRSFSPSPVPPNTFPSHCIPSIGREWKGHIRFGPEQAIITQKEIPLRPENGAKI